MGDPDAPIPGGDLRPPARSATVLPVSSEERVEDNSGASETSASPLAAESPGLGKSPASDSSSRWWWLLAVALVVEFWVFGHRGEIRVCVGKEGVHDFELIGQPRTDENRWSVPRCEQRLNLGLLSEYDAQVTEATEAACRGATLFKHRGEASACAEATQGWRHDVTASFVAPWDARSRERLLWFLYD